MKEKDYIALVGKMLINNTIGKIFRINEFHEKYFVIQYYQNKIQFPMKLSDNTTTINLFNFEKGIKTKKLIIFDNNYME